ncbi:hypothetical protein [Halorussus halobius]|uniref:hypothetical protein n=1 Tax=Halorussus halobius TaxID=1710537 RepID=UPI00109303BE|nr:hypothetical protein [Halorussus halobius]
MVLLSLLSHGTPLMIQILIRFLSPIGDYIVVGFFFGFFIIAGIAIWLRQKPYVKPSFFAFFFTCLIVVNIVGIPVLPAVSMHKFPNSAPEERATSDIRLVDAQGNELPYDARAVPPLADNYVSVIGDQMLAGMTEAKRQQAAAYLFEEAVEYRNEFKSDSIIRLERFSYPQHALAYRWNESKLEEYGEFVKLRVYDERIVYTEDGSEIRTHETELVLEFDFENHD